jgi:hypothetical protein
MRCIHDSMTVAEELVILHNLICYLAFMFKNRRPSDVCSQAVSETVPAPPDNFRRVSTF